MVCKQIGFRQRNYAHLPTLLEKVRFPKSCRITRFGCLDQDTEDLAAPLAAELVGFVREGRFMLPGPQSKSTKIATIGGVG